MAGVEDEDEVIEQECAGGILDEAKYGVSLGLQEENAMQEGDTECYTAVEAKAVEQEVSVGVRDAAKDCVTQGGAIFYLDATAYDIAVEDQEKEMKESDVAIEATLDDHAAKENVDPEDVINLQGDNAAEFQELCVTAGGTTVEDQDKEMEQSAGDESRETEAENAVEYNKKPQEENMQESQEDNMQEGVDSIVGAAKVGIAQVEGVLLQDQDE
ncbi:hypothetical protein ACJX0J_009868, partial [Zea mays]